MSDAGQFGYGQMKPEDTANEFTVVSFICRQIIARLNTMKLVQVVAVTGGGLAPAGTVDVQPLVSQVDGRGYATPHGTVHGLPWSRVQGGKNAIVCDPAVGDIGYVVCSDRDISGVKTNLGVSTPGSRRSFDIADGVYAGGCLNVAPNQYLIFTATGIRLVDANGNSIVMSASGIVLTSASGFVLDTTVTPAKITGNLEVNGTLKVDNLETGEAGLNITGNITATGSITAGQGGADQVGLQTHTHTQGVDSHSDVEEPTNAPTAGT